MLIPDRELADAQATVGRKRTDTATILVYTETTDPMTEITTPDYLPLLTLPCSVAPQGMTAWKQASTNGGQAVTTSVWWITLPPGALLDTVLTPADRIQVHFANGTERTYNVVESQSPRTIELETRVQCDFVR